jgi:predicted nucleic-acid-binding protein
MIGLDTNVMIRYIEQDDPVQSPKADAIINSLTPQDPGYISIITMIEISWVLMGPYKRTKAQVVTALDWILNTQQLMVENSDLVIQALHMYSNGNADFPDCLIERAANAAGCTATLTFDRKAAGAAGMQLIP